MAHLDHLYLCIKCKLRNLVTIDDEKQKVPDFKKCPQCSCLSLATEDYLRRVGLYDKYFGAKS